MEPAFSRAWFETFGHVDEAETAREVAFLLEVLPPAPATVLDTVCADFDPAAAPTGATPRMQAVFRRD